MKTPLEQRLGLAAIAALLATVALYARLRAVAVVFGNEPDSPGRRFRSR